jgi:hypothetical protein
MAYSESCGDDMTGEFDGDNVDSFDECFYFKNVFNYHKNYKTNYYYYYY